MDTSIVSDDTRGGGRSRRVSLPPAYLRASYQLTMPRGRLSNGKRGATIPKRLSLAKKGKEVVQPEQDDGTGAESADSSERSEEDDEEGSDTSTSASHEESADPAPEAKTNDDGCAGTAAPNADMRASQGARDTDVPRGDGRGHADRPVDRTCGNTLNPNGDDVRIPSRVLEQLIQAQDKSAKENARLEALFLNAMSRPSGGSRKRKAQKQRDPGQGCMNRKCQRGKTWSGGSDDEAEDDEDDTHGSGGHHMRTAKSPILQRALEHLPTDKAWKRVCELARVHMFLNRPASTMTFYPSSDDKTHGVCAVLDRLPHSFACLALAADKSRRADLNKTLSEWKTRAAARVRDIALPKLGLFRDDRDASSPWAPEKERSIEKIRERIGLGADRPDRDGMPFASRAFATCAKAAFRPKKAGLVMTLKVYHLAWLEHVERPAFQLGRGNAHVVDGLKVLVKEAVERAIRIRNPEYDAEREAWTWGRHGLRISACGLEHMKPTAAAQSEDLVRDDDLSASVASLPPLPSFPLASSAQQQVAQTCKSFRRHTTALNRTPSASLPACSSSLGADGLAGALLCSLLYPQPHVLNPLLASLVPWLPLISLLLVGGMEVGGGVGGEAGGSRQLGGAAEKGAERRAWEWMSEEVVRRPGGWEHDDDSMAALWERDTPATEITTGMPLQGSQDQQEQPLPVREVLWKRRHQRDVQEEDLQRGRRFPCVVAAFQEASLAGVPERAATDQACADVAAVAALTGHSPEANAAIVGGGSGEGLAEAAAARSVTVQLGNLRLQVQRADILPAADGSGDGRTDGEAGRRGPTGGLFGSEWEQEDDSNNSSSMNSTRGLKRGGQFPSPSSASSTPLPAVREAAVQTARNTVDVRGRSAEDALAAVDLAVQSTPAGAVLFIVHGLGTGVLRAAVLKYLFRKAG
ncbi:unnamed protein product [Closterium sp. NIES-65]|nr:unnamed protein product [Closterium sp. NIES-65]